MRDNPTRWERREAKRKARHKMKVSGRSIKRLWSWIVAKASSVVNHPAQKPGVPKKVGQSR